MTWASITYTFSPSTMARASEVNQNFADVVAGLDKAMPSGGIIAWAYAINLIPSGWFLCDGTNGTPNLVGKYIQGAGAGYAVGATGGEATHTLLIGEIPAHNHGGGNHAHNIGLFYGNVGARGYIMSQTETSLSTYQLSEYSGNIIATQGSGQAHNNLPPFVNLAFIMKS